MLKNNLNVSKKMKTDYIIRDFRDDDYNKIMELWIETGLGNPERGDNLDTIIKSLKHDGAFFIMEQPSTKKIIGTSWITNDSRRLYLHHFGIKPEFQGQKLAKPLLEKSLIFAKQKKLQIKLEVHKDNFKAVNLYSKARFTYLGDYDVYIIRNYNNINL